MRGVEQRRRPVAPADGHQPLVGTEGRGGIREASSRGSSVDEPPPGRNIPDRRRASGGQQPRAVRAISARAATRTTVGVRGSAMSGPSKRSICSPDDASQSLAVRVGPRRDQPRSVRGERDARAPALVPGEDEPVLHDRPDLGGPVRPSGNEVGPVGAPCDVADRGRRGRRARAGADRSAHPTAGRSRPGSPMPPSARRG